MKNFDDDGLNYRRSQTTQEGLLLHQVSMAPGELR
jgi:hypothetical protein